MGTYFDSDYCIIIYNLVLGGIMKINAREENYLLFFKGGRYAGNSQRRKYWIKKCAFCKFWYDPTNSAIKPVKNNPRCWRYTIGEKKLCRLKNYTVNSHSFCSHFECKL